MGLNGVVKRQKRNFRPQNTPILNGGFRADVVNTRFCVTFEYWETVTPINRLNPSAERTVLASTVLRHTEGQR
jgi:hypothetical protein